MRLEEVLPNIRQNVSLKEYSTFRIGGQSKYFLICRTKEELILAIKIAKKFKLPFFILGGGSNVLFDDKKFSGMIIKFQNSKNGLQIKFQNLKYKIIYAEAGISLADLVATSLKEKLTGLEWAVGIPGTFGGAIRGNAGAFGQEMQGLIKSIEVFNVKSGKTKFFKNKDCKFQYRESIFKKNPDLIILSCGLILKRGSKKEIEKNIKKNLQLRKEKHPKNFSAGSIFKNPPPLSKFSAGELIEKCGLKGQIVGGAQFSQIHANFIVNLGNAKSKDVKKLIKTAKKKVKNNFKIILEEEIKIF